MDPSTWTSPAVCPQQGVVRWSIPGILRETGHYEITHYFRLEEGVPGGWGENNQVQDPGLKFHGVVRAGVPPIFSPQSVSLSLTPTTGFLLVAKYLVGCKTEF